MYQEYLRIQINLKYLEYQDIQEHLGVQVDHQLL
jgi:hypothetical protein